MAIIDTITTSSYGFANPQHTSVFTRGGYFYVVYSDKDVVDKLYYRFASELTELSLAVEYTIDIKDPFRKEFDINYSSTADDLMLFWYEKQITPFAQGYPRYARYTFDVDGLLVETYEYRVSGNLFNNPTISRTPNGNPVATMSLTFGNLFYLGTYKSTLTNPPNTTSWGFTRGTYNDGVKYAGAIDTGGSLVYKSETDGYYFYVSRDSNLLPYKIRYIPITGTPPAPQADVDTGIEVEIGSNTFAGYSNAIYVDGNIYMAYSDTTLHNLKLLTFDTSDDSFSVETVDSPSGLDPTNGIGQIRLCWAFNRPLIYTGYDYDDGATTQDFLNVFVKNDSTWDNLTVKLTGDLAVSYNPIGIIQAPEFPTTDEVYMQTESTNLRGSEANWSFAEGIDFVGVPRRGDAPLSVTFTSSVGSGGIS